MKKVISKVEYKCDLCGNQEDVDGFEIELELESGRCNPPPKRWQIIKMEHDANEKHLCNLCISHLIGLWKQR